MPRFYQLTGFRYSVLGVGLLIVALILFMIADTPSTTPVYNSPSGWLVFTESNNSAIIPIKESSSLSEGLLVLRVWLENSTPLLAGKEKPNRIDVYYFIGERGKSRGRYAGGFNLSRGYGEVYTPLPDFIGLVCSKCSGSLMLGFNYTLYRIERPYFGLVWPGVGFMALGVIFGILGLVYISLEVKLVYREKQ